jgi:hypothetical protein
LENPAREFEEPRGELLKQNLHIFLFNGKMNFGEEISVEEKEEKSEQ